MPFYEYSAVDPKKSCDYCRDKFEIMASIKSDNIQKCPECGNTVVKIISLIAGVIWKGRQANQYNDIKKAKYWRDNDGNKWKVDQSDGTTNSPTVPRRRKRSDEQVDAIIKKQKQNSKKNRNQASYNRFVKRIKKR